MLIELLEFAFRDLVHFVGTLILIAVTGFSIGAAMPGPLVSVRHYHGDEE